MNFSLAARSAVLDGIVAPGNLYHAYLSLWHGEEVDFHPRQHAELYPLMTGLQLVEPVEWHAIPTDILGIALYDSPDAEEPLLTSLSPVQKGVSITLTGFELSALAGFICTLLRPTV